MPDLSKMCVDCIEKATTTKGVPACIVSEIGEWANETQFCSDRKLHWVKSNNNHILAVKQFYEFYKIFIERDSGISE